MEILSNLHDLDDLAAAKVALPELSVLEASVTDLTSKDFTLVALDYLAQYPNLTHTRNIGIETDARDMPSLTRLRRCNILVHHTRDASSVLYELYNRLDVRKKTDDQYWRIQLGEDGPRVYIKNNVVFSPIHVQVPDGMQLIELSWIVLPTPFVALLRDILPYLKNPERYAIETCVKYHIGPRMRYAAVLSHAKESMGIQEYRRLVLKHMHKYMRAAMDVYTDAYYYPGQLDEYIQNASKRFDMSEFYDPIPVVADIPFDLIQDTLR